MKLLINTRKFFAILVLLAFSSLGWSQGIVTLTKQVFVNQALTEAPAPNAFALSVVKFPKHAAVPITMAGATFTYTPQANFRGLDTFTVKYSQLISPVTVVNYKTYIVKYDYSFVSIKPDYAFTNKNQAVNINVLGNDVSTAFSGTSSLDVTEISLINNGQNAFINGNGEIVFTPSTDFTGIAYLNYVACNGFDNCATGAVSIVVNQTPIAATNFLRVSTSKNTPVALLLQNAGFAVSANGKKGTTTLMGGAAFNYVPNTGFTGKDTVTFVNVTANINTKYEIEVINKAIPNKYAVDDYAYTPIGQAVSVDVVANDKAVFPVVGNGYTQPSAAQGTVSFSNGKFVFTPTANFKGIATFTYLLQNQSGIPSLNPINEWATAYVVVSNQYPEKALFELSTPVNTPLVLNYKIPITGFNFQIIDNANNGAVTYHPGHTTLNLSNQSVSGYNLLVYTPNTGFEQIDEFEVWYTINGNTRTVKFKVDVKPVTPSLPSYCVGDCVWSGDANNDGIVDMADILPLGYCQGEQGLSRSNASTNWFGQFGNNWNNPFMAGNDLKYIDTNGDGQVSAMDTTALLANYLKAHNITAEKQQNYKAVPFYFELLTPNPQIGDFVEVDVLLGKASNKVTDLNGFTMNFTYDDQVINAASLQVSYYQNSWMTYNSPILRLYKKPYDGRFDVGYTRTAGIAASGFGKVAKLGFIIDDQLAGIRDNDGIYYASITMEGGAMMGADGITYSLPLQEIKIPIKMASSKVFDAEKVVVYPNPATEVVNLYINGGYEMTGYQVYNINGQLIAAKDLQARYGQLKVSNYESGIYFVKIISNEGVVTKKFEVIR